MYISVKLTKKCDNKAKKNPWDTYYYMSGKKQQKID